MIKGLLNWILGSDTQAGQPFAQPHKVTVPQIITPEGAISYPVVSPTGVLPENVYLMTAVANPPHDSAASQGTQQPAPLTIFGGSPDIMPNNAPGGMG